jgi:MmyB-like transcription regulator ligand binding domain
LVRERREGLVVAAERAEIVRSVDDDLPLKSSDLRERIVDGARRHCDEHGVCARGVTAVRPEFDHLMPGVPPTRGQPSADGPSAYGRDPHGANVPGPSWDPPRRVARYWLGSAVMSATSDDFREWSSTHDVETHHYGSKHYNHPLVGDITVFHEATQLAEGDQYLFLYSVEPGSPSEDAMRLLESLVAKVVPVGQR